MPDTYTSQTELARRQKLMEAMQGRNTTGQGIGGGLANMLRGYRGGKENAALGQAEAQNESIDNSERQMILNQLKNQTQNAAPGVLKPGESYNFQGKYKDFPLQQAMSQQTARQNAEAEANKPYTLGSLQERRVGNQVVASNTNQRAPTTNINMPGADNQYIKDRMAAGSENFQSLENSATSAVQANRSLDNFMASSANADAGGAQPLISGVKNFLSSFGFEDAALTDVALMEQAVGQILGQKMEELGARGLTDKDMEVLKSSLPRVNTSHDARMAVADVLKRANENIINEYLREVEYENQDYPDNKFRRPPWTRGYTPSTSSPSSSAADMQSVIDGYIQQGMSPEDASELYKLENP